jgi:hypothetical protein
LRRGGGGGAPPRGRTRAGSPQRRSGGGGAPPRGRARAAPPQGRSGGGGAPARDTPEHLPLNDAAAEEELHLGDAPEQLPLNDAAAEEELRLGTRPSRSAEDAAEVEGTRLSSSGAGLLRSEARRRSAVRSPPPICYFNSIRIDFSANLLRDCVIFPIQLVRQLVQSDCWFGVSSYQIDGQTNRQFGS